MSREKMDIIDSVVTTYYRTKDRKYADVFLKEVIPIIKLKVQKTCIGSVKWDKDELYSILLVDMWRLLKVYVPEEGRKFHHLMLRQLNNKTINYIQNTTGRKYCVCFACSKSNKAGTITCTNCGTSLGRPIVMPVYDFDLGNIHNHTPDYLTEIGNKQLVERVLNNARRTNEKTYRILLMFLMGFSKKEISNAFGGVAQNALNNRIRNCKKSLQGVHSIWKDN